MKRLALILVAAMSCGDDGTQQGTPDAPPGPVYPDGFAPPDPPPGGIQLLGRPFVVAPGEEVFKCIYLDARLPADMDIGGMQSYQMEGGHHILLSWVTDSYTPPDELHECTDTEMVFHRFIGAGGADPNLALDMPDGVALKVPGQKRLVIQAHYLNATDEPIEVMDAVNLVPMDTTIEQYASMAAQVDDTFELLPMAPTTRDLTCLVTQPSSVFQLVGHTHEWGKKYRYSIERADGSPIETLYENLAIAPDFRDNAQVRTWPPDAPLQLAVGDKLHLHCEWENTTMESIFFPQEMCVAAFYYFPSRGFEVCTIDGGTFEPQDLN